MVGKVCITFRQERPCLNPHNPVDNDTLGNISLPQFHYSHLSMLSLTERKRIYYAKLCLPSSGNFISAATRRFELLTSLLTKGSDQLSYMTLPRSLTLSYNIASRCTTLLRPELDTLQWASELLDTLTGLEPVTLPVLPQLLWRYALPTELQCIPFLTNIVTVNFRNQIKTFLYFNGYLTQSYLSISITVKQ